MRSYTVKSLSRGWPGSHVASACSNSRWPRSPGLRSCFPPLQRSQIRQPRDPGQPLVRPGHQPPREKKAPWGRTPRDASSGRGGGAAGRWSWHVRPIHRLCGRLSLNVPDLAMPTRGPTLATVSRGPDMSTGTEFSGRGCWYEVTNSKFGNTGCSTLELLTDKQNMRSPSASLLLFPRTLN